MPEIIFKIYRELIVEKNVNNKHYNTMLLYGVVCDRNIKTVEGTKICTHDLNVETIEGCIHNFDSLFDLLMTMAH